MKKKPTPRDKIYLELFTRLSNYKRKSHEFGCLHVKGLTEQILKEIDEIKTKSPPQSTLAGLIELIKINGDIIVTTGICEENGWMLLKQLEQPSSPYGAPKVHRYKFLKNSLLERGQFVYNRPKRRGRRLKKEVVYRLKRDHRTKIFLTQFYDAVLQNKSYIYYDYFQDRIETHEPEPLSKKIRERLLRDSRDSEAEELYKKWLNKSLKSQNKIFREVCEELGLPFNAYVLRLLRDEIRKAKDF